jgi:hypothetical protein
MPTERGGAAIATTGAPALALRRVLGFLPRRAATSGAGTAVGARSAIAL